MTFKLPYTIHPFPDGGECLATDERRASWYPCRGKFRVLLSGADGHGWALLYMGDSRNSDFAKLACIAWMINGTVAGSFPIYTLEEYGKRHPDGTP